MPHEVRCGHLCAESAVGGTLDSCSIGSDDFFTGTGPRCPWSSCFPSSPAVRICDPGLCCVRPRTG
ncbi:hypothetical protein C1S81_17735 [Mycolicibacterium neoaurum]|nr:hypothetical protein C1S81_17735 [Mycolicibacterium neoaurum]